jgi:hypothetical protein
MSRNFPHEMQTFVKSSTLKLALLLEPDSCPPNSCKNCGGLGHLYVFGASEGPYQNPTSPYRGDRKISKWHNGSFTCPDCKGLGYIEAVR